MLITPLSPAITVSAATSPIIPDVWYRFENIFLASEGCKGFAKYVFKKMFDLDLPSTAKNYYQLNSSTSIISIGSFTNPSEQTLKDLMSKAKTEDVIQSRYSTTHTMIF